MVEHGLEYDPALPVVERRPELLEALQAHQVVIVCGATGSGKSTQLPKMCLELGRGGERRVAHTQPRRLAARTLAHRVADELGEEVGGTIGYRVRFTDRVSQGTRVKFVTDGMLLAEIQRDRDLADYDTVIIDEAHERSLNIDFLLGYLRRLLPRRPDLQVIITSATIDPDRFSRHFDDAPVFEVSGRTYPVEVRYRAPESEDWTAGVVSAVRELCAEGPGDILAFFSGEREIREAAEALRKQHPAGTEILPLYARLSAREQKRAFERGGSRKIVLATNVAETSVTVPGIRYVVDTGYARIARYSHRTKVSRLPVEPISQASADQRAGRCGREAPGICIRLYEEEDYAARPRFTDPEIQRTNLASVILQMKALRLGEIAEFPFVDPPERKFINDGIRLLQELQALDDRGRLTDLGRRLSRFPLDPRYARMLLAAEHHRVLRPVRVIVAGLSIQDPRERPMEAREAADAAHARWQHPKSDFLSLLRLWRDYHAQKRHLSRRKLDAWCREHFVSPLRMREWVDVHRQIQEMSQSLEAETAGAAPTEEDADYEAVHRALLTGLLGQVAHQHEEREYLGPRGIKLVIHPGSGLAGRKPKWIVAAEMVETRRLFGRMVAEVKPEWIEDAAAHRVSRSYHGAHWSKRMARVMAYERVTLYGLVLFAQRRVHYGPLDPEASREIFIREALVGGAYRTRAAFFAHNREQIEAVERLEAKARRQDLLVDEEERFAFYDARIPAGIHNGAAFEKWLRKVTRANPHCLHMSRDDLVRADPATFAAAEDYPDALTVRGVRVTLRYELDPGAEVDGIVARVPLEALNALAPEPFQWLVPGLRHEKVTAMIRALPKSLRRHFVPAPDFARAVLEAAGPADGVLEDVVARELQRITGVELPPGVFEDVALPQHLRMHFELLDGEGVAVDQGEDLRALQERWREEATQRFAAAGGAGGAGADAPTAAWYREGVTSWDVGTLPEQVHLGGADGAQPGLVGYPALQDAGDSVTLTLLDAPEAAAEVHRKGVRRLFMLASPQQVRYVRRDLPQLRSLRLAYRGLGSDDALRDQLVAAAVDRAFLGGASANTPGDARGDRVPRDPDAFARALEEGRPRLVDEAERIAAELQEILDRYQAVRQGLKQLNSLQLMDSLHDLQQHLDALVYPGFLTDMDPRRLAELPRYLRGVEKRIEKLRQDPSKERRPLQAIRPWWERWSERAARRAEQGRRDAELERFRWLLEEYRISLFAQEIGAREKVSEKRIEAAWRELP